MARQTFVFIAAAAFAPALLAQQSAIPVGAPTASCESKGARSLDALRILNGDTPVPYVFACGENRPAGLCVVTELKPHAAELQSNLVISVDHTQGVWSCILADEVSGWVPADRLSPLPGNPAISAADWLGWWRSSPDRLLITRSRANPGVLHVSGRAFWYGLKDNVHFGQIDADALAHGPYLHVVDPADGSGCVLDLTYAPSTHTFNAIDNALCGGMNVRFSGVWTRFKPKTRSRK